MKNIINILLVVILFGATLNAQHEIKMDLESFDELKVFDQINVTLIKADKNHAHITGDDTQEVSIVNDEGRLKIKMDTDDFLEGNKTMVALYHTEDFKLLDANEGSRIVSEGELTSKYLNLRVQEGGKINALVKARNLDSKAVTGGEIAVSGNAEIQEVSVRTGGDYNGKNLTSKQTDVTIMAGGKAIVNASDFVDANVTAGGTIEIYGNPEIVKENKTFGGIIKVRP